MWILPKFVSLDFGEKVQKVECLDNAIKIESQNDIYSFPQLNLNLVIAYVYMLNINIIN